MKKFTHWVFDLDGTIINSLGHYDRASELILTELGITPTKEDISRNQHFFDPADYFATFALEKEQIRQAVQRLMKMNLEEAHLVPTHDGIEDLMVFLKSQEVRISVWTGRDLPSAKKILNHTGIHKYVATCVGGTCVQKNKPYPDGLMKILTESKYHEDDVVMVGDHLYDMQGALAAKVTGISVDWDGRGHKEARSLSSLHFDSVKALHSWAKKIYS